MITQKTTERIWCAYREIEASEKLLTDLNEVREQERERETSHRPDKFEPRLKDAFGRKQHLELGVPSGESGHRIFRVAPELAESVIRAHIAKQKAELQEANEIARNELEEDRS